MNSIIVHKVPVVLLVPHSVVCTPEATQAPQCPLVPEGVCVPLRYPRLPRCPALDLSL